MPFCAIKYPVQQKKKGTASLAMPCTKKNTYKLLISALLNTWIAITQTEAIYFAKSML